MSLKDSRSLTNWARDTQLGLILNSLVSPLKWGQVEVNCLILSKDTSSQSGKGISHFSENNIDFERLSLLNKLSNWAQPGLILKSSVCSLKWAQVEVKCSIRLGDIGYRSYHMQWILLFMTCTYNLWKNGNIKKMRSWKFFALICHRLYMGRTTRNCHKSGSSPSLKYTVAIQSSGQELYLVTPP